MKLFRRINLICLNIDIPRVAAGQLEDLDNAISMLRAKALLIGLRYDDDPGTETLAGPHQDVQSLKRLLISEWCLVCVC